MTATMHINELQDRLELRMEVLRDERGDLDHEAVDSWPVAPGTTAFDIPGTPLASGGRSTWSEALHVHELGVVMVRVIHGEIQVRALSKTPANATALLQRVRELIPRGENPDPDVVPVTFWTYSPHGPQAIRRDLDAAEWTSIAGNYTAATAGGVGHLVTPDFRPGVGGQLVLWHGDPGTGKTTALRALAREWRDWCELHYVVDPEHFFGAHADYMMGVLMGGGQDLEVYGPDGIEKPKWRLLVLEDCGEMLQPDARREVGQALSRFLNACDGLIGRGLRILVLVTTNEPVAKLHEAVSRPGRCAARVEFERFGHGEAARWLREHGAEDTVSRVRGTHLTLADLFGLIEGFGTERADRVVGFAA